MIVALVAMFVSSQRKKRAEQAPIHSHFDNPLYSGNAIEMKAKTPA